MNPENENPGFDLSPFWRLLQDLEDRSILPEKRDELMTLLRDSPEARIAYFEFFQQTAIFEMEGAKMEEAGHLPVLNTADSSRRLFRRSLAVAAVVTAILAIVATLIVIKQPEPSTLQARIAAETRWTIDEVPQDSTGQQSEVTEGATVTVLSGTLELAMDSGTVLVMQGPATVTFQDLRKPFLEKGWLWVDSSEDEEDFAVETEAYLIRDVGTRFGLRASKRHPLEVHLVEGQVEITDKKKDDLIATLRPSGKGQAVNGDEKIAETQLALDPFPSLPALLAARGDLKTTILSQSPVGYWRFEEVLPGPLQNEVSDQMTAGCGLETGLGAPGLGSKREFQGISGDNRGIYLTGSKHKSLVFGLGNPQGISTSEGAVSFWICGDGQSESSQTLWLAGRSDPSSLEPTETLLHTSITQNGRVRFGVDIGGEQCELNSGKNILNTKWHHIVASWSASTIDLFVDGKLVDRHSPSSPLIDERLTGRFVRFGKPGADLRAEGMVVFKGWLDEVATWNRPLTHAEVLHQYESARR